MMKRQSFVSESAEDFAASMELLANEQLTDKEGLDLCRPVLLRDIEDNFDLATSAAGVPWPPHAPLTVAIYGPHPLLILTGKMKSAAIGEGAGKVERNDGESLELGVDCGTIPYARVHQEGYRNIPQREYLAISDTGIDNCVEVMADRGLERAALTAV